MQNLPELLTHAKPQTKKRRRHITWQIPKILKHTSWHIILTLMNTKERERLEDIKGKHGICNRTEIIQTPGKALQPEETEIILLKYWEEKNPSAHSPVLNENNFHKRTMNRSFPDQESTKNPRRTHCLKIWHKEMLREVFQAEGIRY